MKEHVAQFNSEPPERNNMYKDLDKHNTCWLDIFIAGLAGLNITKSYPLSLTSFNNQKGQTEHK